MDAVPKSQPRKFHLLMWLLASSSCVSKVCGGTGLGVVQDTTYHPAKNPTTLPYFAPAVTLAQ
jgi:hypothetical protein